MLLEDTLELNEGENQEREKHGIQEMRSNRKANENLKCWEGNVSQVRPWEKSPRTMAEYGRPQEAVSTTGGGGTQWDYLMNLTLLGGVLEFIGKFEAEVVSHRKYLWKMKKYKATINSGKNKSCTKKKDVLIVHYMPQLRSIST